PPPAELARMARAVLADAARVAHWADTALRPDRVTLRTVRQAPHGAMWNADPKAYEESLRRFLTPLG
ncbi:hypothetical protein PV374_43815, partial [Streptomyces scabiei]|nr:hypothetical protein [Streptomyces scabiei]